MEEIRSDSAQADFDVCFRFHASPESKVVGEIAKVRAINSYRLPVIAGSIVAPQGNSGSSQWLSAMNDNGNANYTPYFTGQSGGGALQAGGLGGTSNYTNYDCQLFASGHTTLKL
jgi:hypothetical protein